jgi:hypothetical protein
MQKIEKQRWCNDKLDSNSNNIQLSGTHASLSSLLLSLTEIER